MERPELKYEFSGKPYYCSATDGAPAWVFVPLPRQMSDDIRSNFQFLEEGWGRMKVKAKMGGSEWQTSIWFDSKNGIYQLPLKAAIRKKECVEIGKDITVAVFV